MKKLILTGTLLTMFGVIGVMIGCSKIEKTPLTAQTENAKTQKSLLITTNIVLNENNIGEYHNRTIQYLFDDLAKMKNEDLLINITSSTYIAGKMKQFCSENNIQLPSDTELNKALVNYSNTTLPQIISNTVFTPAQRVILTDAFNSLSIANDPTRSQALINFLDSKLTLLKSLRNDPGRKIAIAGINQLKYSTIFWIQKGNINFLDGKGYFGKAKKPSNSEVLGADGRGVLTSLAFGNAWASPIGWCGAMFCGAGASVGKYVDSNWWPY
jgi:hypothetical protein